jgi:hypothetical protein
LIVLLLKANFANVLILKESRVPGMPVAFVPHIRPWKRAQNNKKVRKQTKKTNESINEWERMKRKQKRNTFTYTNAGSNNVQQALEWWVVGL